MKSEKGITLLALVITIIVLSIVLTVGVNEIKGTRTSINESQSIMDESDLAKVQEAVLETYIKYKQTSVETLFKGTKISYSEAKTELAEITSENLKASNYNLQTVSAENAYYKLQNVDLQQMGFSDVNNDEYIVNYSTGEVFNITQKKTKEGKALYVHAK